MNDLLVYISRYEKRASIILTIFYAFGIFFHLWNTTKDSVVLLTEATLSASNILIIIYLKFLNKNNNQFILWLLLTIFVTVIIEALGVYTGKVFGTYHYGDTMKLKIAHVPFIIGVNWAILILASFELAKKIIHNKFLIPFLSGIIIVLLDYIMEPVAMKLDYWQWENDVIPTQNYLVWFIISFIFSILLSILKIKTSSIILVVYFFLQLIFFAVLNIFLV